MNLRRRLCRWQLQRPNFMLMPARAFVTRKTSEHEGKEGHCRYLALSNDLIYDRFIKHQNYVNKPLKTINCCKNCASHSTHTLTAALDSSKLQRWNIIRLFLPSLQKLRKRFTHKTSKNNNTTTSTYHGWIDVKWNFECRQHTNWRAERQMFRRRADHRNINYTFFDC